MDNSQQSLLPGFLRHKSANGILLFFAAIFAMVCANTALRTYYALLLDTPVGIRFTGLEVAKPLLWINDWLMAVFFFIVGLELKRELIEGHLADRRNIILPDYCNPTFYPPIVAL